MLDLDTDPLDSPDIDPDMLDFLLDDDTLLLWLLLLPPPPRPSPMVPQLMLALNPP